MRDSLLPLLWACREKFNIDFLSQFFSWLLHMYIDFEKFLGQNVNVKFLKVAPSSKVIFEMSVTKKAGNDTFH